MAGSDVIKKLNLKPQQMAAILHAPPGFRAALGQLPEGVRMLDESSVGSQPDGTCDFVLLFAGSVTDVEARAPRALRFRPNAKVGS